MSNHNEELQKISELLKIISTSDLRAEIVYSALDHVARDSRLKRSDALILALNEWDIIDTPTVNIVCCTTDEDTGVTKYLLQVDGKPYQLTENNTKVGIFPCAAHDQIIINEFYKLKDAMIKSGKWK